MFIDYAKIFIKAGDGGNGCVGFRREKFVPFGGPDGGNGGKGGDVIIEANSKLNTLLDFRYKRHYKAVSGGQGEGSLRSGKSSSDVIIKVPLGTLVRDASTGEVLADIVNPDDRIIVAKGGRGGKGNAEYTTSTNKAPRYAQDGVPGEEYVLILELKLFADVGLVGLPNAGKSTLLSRISAAKPKIANYPFTTLAPQLGVVDHAGHTFVVADIPGIVERAHEGKGLGFDFLKHIERTRFLLFVVDISETMELNSPLDTFLLLKEELKLYSSELAQKNYVVAGSKFDVMGEAEKWKELELYLKKENIEFFMISSVRGDGVDALLKSLGRHTDIL